MNKDFRATQRGQILELLIRAHGDWVPLLRIAACAAQYNARSFVSPPVVERTLPLFSEGDQP